MFYIIELYPYINQSQIKITNLNVLIASYLEKGPLMWMMHLHVNQKSDYDEQ